MVVRAERLGLLIGPRRRVEAATDLVSFRRLRDDAVASYFGLVNSDCYLLMTETLGWDLDRWQGWLIGLLSDELLGTAPDTDHPGD